MESQDILKRNCFSLAMLLIFSIASVAVNAQSFSVFGVDASKFPTVSTRFVAIDQGGQEFSNFQASEFSVSEAGKSMNSSLKVICEQVVAEPAANVVMVLDRSGSMTTVVDKKTGETRWDWVTAGATEFVNQFKFIPPSQVSILSFGSTINLESDFRNTRTPLINAILGIRPQGSTKYDPPFLDTAIGAIKLLSKQDPQVRRIIIFLTDGDPDQTPHTDSIITLCKKYNIIVYSITVGLSMNDNLARISTLTGGKTFEVFTKDRLKEIYRLIALETTIKNSCRLEWTAPFGCDEPSRIRSLSVTFKRPTPAITSNTEYTAPSYSVAGVNLSQSTLYFGDPPPTNTTTQKITIKAINSPIHFDSAKFIPAGFFDFADMDGKTFPFDLDTGKEWKPTIKFTQGASKAFRQATLLTYGIPCPPIVSLVGGLSSVQVLSPNGNERYSTCDTVDIRWAGVEPTLPVVISYTTDGTNPNPQWTTISSNAKGLSYKWLPPQPGLNYRIRITAAPQLSYLWSKSAGGTLLDTCRSVALDAQNLYVMTAGSFSDMATFAETPSPIVKNSLGSLDIFVARYDSDGNLIWVQTGGGNRDDRATCVATDAADGIYAAGFFTSQTIQLGSTTQSLPNSYDKCNMWVAKFDASGNTPWVVRGGGTVTAEGYAVADSIAFYNGKIYVQGRYSKRLRINGKEIYHNPVPATALYIYTAVFDVNGGILSLSEGPDPNSIPYTRANVTDKDGNIYETGGYSGTLKSGTLSNTSKGDYDVYLRKYGGIPGSADVSDNVFKVVSPVLSFKQTTVDVGSVAQGQSGGNTFTGILCNDGELPLIISGSSIGGTNTTDFRLVSNLNNRVLQPGQCVDIELQFNPSDVGPRSATLTVFAKCANPVVLQVTATGLPPCSFSTVTPQLGSVSVNILKTVNESCIIRNEGTQVYSGTLKITGTNADEFEVIVKAAACTVNVANTAGCGFSLNPKQCLDVDINFKPKASGLRTAKLNVELPAECGGFAEIGLVGNGIAPRLTINDIDWGMQRVMVSVTKKDTIMNSDTVEAEVTSIALATAPDANFSLSNLPSVPFKLQPKAYVTFDVTYTPQTEGPHTNSVSVDVSGNVNPLRGRLSGEGFIPQLTADDISFQPAPLNIESPEIIDLVIKNPHAKADLLVKSVAFAPGTTSFYFDPSDIPPPNVTIPAGTQKNYKVRFNPKNPGLNTATINIISDAAAGPNPSPDVPKDVKVTGEALDIGSNTITPFGDVLLCDTTQTRVITFTNSGSAEMKITYTLNGDATVFDVSPKVDTITVPPSPGSASITIKLNPKQGSFKGTLEVKTPVRSFSYTLDANGTVVNVPVNGLNIPLDVGGKGFVPVEIIPPALPGVIADKLIIKVSYDKNALKFDDATPIPVSGAWAFTAVEGDGEVTLTGTANPGLQSGTKITLQVPFSLFVTSDAKFDITPLVVNAADYPCLNFVYGNKASIDASIPCFAAGRKIIVGSQQYMLNVQPNPADKDITIQYGLGLSTPYTINVYNAMGEVIHTYTDASATAGLYEATLPVSQLAGGVYIVRIQAGPYTQSQRVVVTK